MDRTSAQLCAPETAISQLILFDISGDGHRLNYLRFFAAKLGGQWAIGSIRDNFWFLLKARVLMLTTFESAPKSFAFIVLLRSLIGRKSAVLILRPFTDGKGIKHAVKRSVHYILARSPGVRILVIMPVKKGSALYGKSTFIYDPEFWDIDDVGAARCETGLSRDASTRAAGRSVIICAGMFSIDKGMAQLAAMMEHEDWPNEKIAVVATGKFSADEGSTKDRLIAAGAFVTDRFISDEELFSMYSIAHSVWVCYAPERDMSSGLVGRALQFGVLPIVREDSALTYMLGSPERYLALPWSNVDESTARIRRLGEAIESNSKPFTIDKNEQLAELTKIVTWN
jgi:hypothetical protein